MKKFLPLLLWFVFLNGCGNTELREEIEKAYPHMQALIKDLSDKYKEKTPNINVFNNRTITVSFVDSSFNSLPTEAKKDKTKEVATYVASHLHGICECETINIDLIEFRQFIIFHVNKSERFSFTVKDLLQKTEL